MYPDNINIYLNKTQHWLSVLENVDYQPDTLQRLAKIRLGFNLFKILKLLFLF